MSESRRCDPYRDVTERIVAMLKAGTAPWRRPWSLPSGGGLPRNLRSGRAYRGVNVLLLAMTGFDRPEWVSYRQAQGLGGHVRKGERGTRIIYWNWHERTEEDPKTGEQRTRRVPFLRVYTVFNVGQCEGLDLAPLEDGEVRPFAPIDAAARIWDGYTGRPDLGHGGGRAFYQPATDRVQMPEPGRFASAEDYYATLFHEATHSTGHKSRLAREGITDVHAFGDPVYSREELVAEMGSAFLCAEAGIEPVTLGNSAAYLASWIRVLKGSPKLAVTAAAQAQKAADLILGRSWQDKD